jgi:16S rRNA (guanine527-N7)-methyltransferase
VLAVWSGRTNLTAARTAEARVRVLVEPALPAVALLEPGRLIDVGSGNGSPGLVLALLRPDLPATLLEPRARRWAFLLEACRAAGRADIDVLRARHDEYRGPGARNVTLRALRLGCRELLPLVEPGGQALFFGEGAPGDPAFQGEPAPPGLTRYRRVSRETRR